VLSSLSSAAFETSAATSVANNVVRIDLEAVIDYVE